MYVIRVDNVCEALPFGIGYLLKQGYREISRDGEVLVSPSPVTTVYSHPQKCVLTNSVRDSNPFFTLGEALWVLNGQKDAAFLNRYVSDFGSRFAEADGNIHGAYGYRLRKHFGNDQLAEVIAKLRRDPSTRQAVISMWDPAQDLAGEFKDRPCNLTIVFNITDDRLNMMVYNRSNDIVMGAYGANAVHFSFIQQYVAGMLGLKVGLYWQVSFNYHAYQRDIDKLVLRAGVEYDRDLVSALYSPYKGAPQPLIDAPDTFDAELAYFMSRAKNGDLWGGWPAFKNRFLRWTALPMLQAHAQFKNKDYSAASLTLTHIRADDWGTEARMWLSRRLK